MYPKSFLWEVDFWEGTELYFWIVKATDSSFELRRSTCGLAGLEKIGGGDRSTNYKLYLQIRLETVCTFNGSHETNTWKRSKQSQFLWWQRKCLGKAAGLMFVAVNISATDNNSSCCSLLVSQLNIPLFWFVHTYLEAHYLNSLSSEKILNLNQKAHGAAGRSSS